MVYLDSSVFVYAVTHDPTKNKKAKEAVNLLTAVEEGRTRGVTSILTWDELSWVVRKLEGREAALRAGAALLRIQNLVLYPTTLTVVLKAQELAERYSLAPRDAIHVSTGLITGEREIVTEDADFDDVREISRHPLG